MLMVDDDLEQLFAILEARGEDMTLMREAGGDLAAMPVGDHTPPPPSRLREPTTELGWVRDATLLDPPVIYEGENESPEGPKFFTHASLRPPRRPEKRITLRSLNTELAHLRQFVAVFAFFVLFVLAVMALNWSSDWP